MAKRIISSDCSNKDNAFIIPDYPFGSRIRCYKRMWVETAKKGPKKGMQRVVYQTTRRSFNEQYTESLGTDSVIGPPVKNDSSWNNEKRGTYGAMQLIYHDDDEGLTTVVGLGEYPWPQHCEEFERGYFHMLDEKQRERFLNIKEQSRL